MMRTRFADRFRFCLMVSALVALDTMPVGAAEDDGVQGFLRDIAKQAEAAEKRDQTAVAGRDGWMYFVPELRALSVGPFWGDNAAKVSRSSKPENADPLPAILDFHRQLKDAGIELLLVPVPAKAAIYPEGISTAAKASSELPRLDPAARDFYRLLEREGVGVIDLTPIFLKQHDRLTDPLFCRTDTHWSGMGIKLAVRAIADRVRDRDFFRSAEQKDLAFEVRDVEITGDLAQMLDDDNPIHETVEVRFSGKKPGDEIVPFEPSRDSPVLLIGDSHTLVFHDPTLFGPGGGLADQLAVRFGFPVDLIGVRGSGANSPRIDLLRRGDNLKGKKLVIWCFSFREFTESTSGWRKIPVIK